ncbi:MAG: type II toxin-antitoxin system ParD family antitoxin [bacterium]
MATMNISLNDQLKGFVQERITQTGFSNVSDYIRSLIREDQQRYQQQRLEQLLLEGLDSGKAEQINEQFWQNLQQRISH